jgi:hypothetical protein
MEKIPNNINIENSDSEQLPKPNTSESIHPIMTSIGTVDTYNELKEQYPNIPNLENDLGLTTPTDVDWHSDSKALEKSGLLNAGEYTYVISKIDSNDKLSKEYSGCTGLVVSGLENDTGNYISFVTHQDLADMTPEQKVEFIKHLEVRFTEMKDRSTTGSIDVVIIGGNQFKKNSTNYTSAIKFLSEEIRKGLGVEPTIFGPKINGVYDNVFYNNKDRRLYLVRSDEKAQNIPFRGDQINEKRKEWEGF